ncbi:MAG TPA: hypothetical protein VH877_24755 [Polyangia bacterium]|jgi:hypothetical protein|nr:hypothetical protein [Polyangia bacterium]
MPTRNLQADGSIRFEDEQGKAVLLRVRPGVVLLTYTGHLKADFFTPLRLEMEYEIELAHMQKKALVMIADCWELKGVETGFRELWMHWLESHRGEVGNVLGLIQSRLVAMATSIMSIFLGGGLIKMYSDPAEFDKAVERFAPGLGWGRRVRAALGTATEISRRARVPAVFSSRRS